jgi:hypothetical protein
LANKKSLIILTPGFTNGGDDINECAQGQIKKNFLTVVNATEKQSLYSQLLVLSGNTKEGSITIPLTSCLTGLD